MKTKHTPGPWKVWEPEWDQTTKLDGTPGKRYVRHIIVGKEIPGDVTQELAYVHCDSGYFDDRREPVPSEFCNDATAHPEAIANARIIAQAPALLAALKFALRHLEDPNPTHLMSYQNGHRKAMEVLAAAEGK